jgi:hypothetical protein
MLAFIHISKTGGNTVSRILRSNYGVDHCQVEPWHARWKGPPFSAEDLQRVRRIYPNLKSIAGHRVFGYVDLPENGAELRYFTLMRDPLKRCASRYQFDVQTRRHRMDIAFEEWIQRDWPRNVATKMIAGEVDVDKAIRIIKDKDIFVGFTERFDESMMLLKRLMANDLDISYKRVNTARDNTIKDRLLSTESTRQMLIDAQKADLELYDYVERELYPTYQRKYGPSLEKDVAEFQQTQSKDYNNMKLTSFRMKQVMLYKPLLYLNRKGIALV